ncbi:MAG: hypothetical protein KAI43_13010 [Candidatus Aureabacteria bacterium]|nr:hypothetical protein [Candidatus Auribacterota bacterium]
MSIDKIKNFSKNTDAQAMVEYILIVSVIIFGTLVAVNGVTLYEIGDDQLVRIPGFKDALNAYLWQIYHLLHIFIP